MTMMENWASDWTFDTQFLICALNLFTIIMVIAEKESKDMINSWIGKKGKWGIKQTWHLFVYLYQALWRFSGGMQLDMTEKDDWYRVMISEGKSIRVQSQLLIIFGYCEGSFLPILHIGIVIVYIDRIHNSKKLTEKINHVTKNKSIFRMNFHSIQEHS